MHPPATLFVDVCVQRDLWPGGAWQLVSPGEAEAVGRLCLLARELHIRRGSIVCFHGPGLPVVADGVPSHCHVGFPGSDRPADTALPAPDAAVDCASGCAASPDEPVAMVRAFDRMTAGIRDAVVFGAGVEYGIAQV